MDFEELKRVLFQEVTGNKYNRGYFNKNYVQPEIFPRELGRKIVKAEEIRVTGI